MRNWLTSSMAGAAILCLAAQSPAAAQAPKPAAAIGAKARGKTGGALRRGWRTARRIFQACGWVAAACRPRNLKPGDTIDLLPGAKKIMDSRQLNDDPEAHCLPTGVPRMNPYPWRMVQSIDMKYIFILFEGNIHSYRQIFLDGRKHPTDPDPTWYGHSVGKWEKDTLVVDTIGYNDLFWFGANGLPHTTQLHTIERFTRTDLNTLSWDITINDPGAFAKPFTVQTRARLEPTWELMEYICQENNTNVGHIQGAANSGTANGGELGR